MKDYREEKRWKAHVIGGMKWRELDVKAQMGNTMGNTNWKASMGEVRVNVEVREIEGYGRRKKRGLQMDSDSNVRVDGMFGLDASGIEASGGAISGEMNVHSARIYMSHVVKNKVRKERVCESTRAISSFPVLSHSILSRGLP